MKMVGATVVGPSHAQSGTPNQDAFGTIRGNGYVLAVVCDGMGSAAFGRQGAESAVQSVGTAVRIWMEARANSVDRLLKLVHQIWNIKVEQWGGREAATTCLFAFVRNDGSGLLARLGDGLVLAEISELGVLRLAEQKEGFANETRAMGTVSDLKHWQTVSFDSFRHGDSILICSDGISEDLEADKELQFMHFLKDKYGRKWRWRGKQLLKRDLRNWPTDMHSDDKTICLLWK